MILIEKVKQLPREILHKNDYHTLVSLEGVSENPFRIVAVMM